MAGTAESGNVQQTLTAGLLMAGRVNGGARHDQRYAATSLTGG